MLQVRSGYGALNLSTSLTTLGSFRVQAPFTRDSLINSGHRVYGTATHTPTHPQFQGAKGITQDSVTHPEGTFVLLTFSQSRRGIPVTDAAILMRLRENAAVLTIGARTPIASDCMIPSPVNVFQGKADLLSVEEAEELGLRLPRSFVARFFDPEQIEECYEVTELAAAVEARPQLVKVMTAGGIVTTEVKAEPARRLRFRK